MCDLFSLVPTQTCGRTHQGEGALACGEVLRGRPRGGLASVDVQPDATRPSSSASARTAAERWARADRGRRATTWPWSWARAGCPRPTPSARPTSTSPSPTCPGFLPPAVAGHAGRVRSRAGGRPAGHGAARPHAPLRGPRRRAGRARRARRRGGRAAGPSCSPTPLAACARACRSGQPVLISDHLNLTAPLAAGGRPLRRPGRPLLGPAARARPLGRPDRWRRACTPPLPGPHYETPAEIRMLRGMGADLVGMSTALEAIAARAEGMEVLGVSLVTNLAAGMTGQPLDHAEVLEAGAASAARVGQLLAGWSASCDGPARCATQVARLDRRRPRPGHPRRAAGAAGRRRRRGADRTASRDRCTSAPPGCAARCAAGRTA